MSTPTKERLLEITEALSQDVAIAEGRRIEKDFDGVEAIAKPWLTYQKLEGMQVRDISALLEAEDEQPDKELVQTVAIGLLGMAQIYFDAAISAHKAEKLHKNQLITIQALYQVTFGLLSTATALPKTIHGGGIHWQGEQIQQEARYFLALGESKKAADALELAIGNFQYEYQQDPDHKHPAHFSTLAVLYLRLAELDREVETLQSALDHLQQSNQHEQYNRQRRQDIAQKALKLLYQGMDGLVASKLKVGVQATAHYGIAVAQSFLGK